MVIIVCLRLYLLLYIMHMTDPALAKLHLVHMLVWIFTGRLRNTF